MAAVFCSLPGQVCYLKWQLTKFLADHVDIFYMDVRMGNNKHKEMKPKFQDSTNAFLLITTIKVSETGPNRLPVNNTLVQLKFYRLSKLTRTCAWCIWLGQNRVSPTSLRNKNPSVYDNHVTDFNQHPAVVPMRVLYGHIRQANITPLIIRNIPQCCEDHT